MVFEVFQEERVALPPGALSAHAAPDSERTAPFSSVPLPLRVRDRMANLDRRDASRLPLRCRDLPGAVGLRWLLALSLVWATAAPAGAAPPDFAQQVLDRHASDELSLVQLLDLPVTTASGRAEERSLAAANVFIVTAEEIRQRGYRSLAEILGRVPGLYLVDDHVNPSVGVREVTGGYRGGTRLIKIMVDGSHINFRPDLESFIGPEFLPMEVIERVEVAKGPLSAMYGANAFLATVNVITKEPEKNSTLVASRFHSTGTHPGWGGSGVVSYAGRRSALMLSFSADRVDRSGLQVTQTYPFQAPRETGQESRSQSDTSSPRVFFGQFDYHHLTLGDFRLNVGRQELNSASEFQLNSVLTHQSRVNLVNQWASLDWSLSPAPRLSMRARLGLSGGESGPDYALFLTNNFTASYTPEFDYRAVNWFAEASYSFGHGLEVDVGVDAERNRETLSYYTRTLQREEGGDPPLTQYPLYDLSVSPKRNLNQLGAYIQLRSVPIRALPDLRFTGSARFDLIEFGPVEYPGQLSLRLAGAYRVSSNLTAKVIAGRAFQTPSGTLLFAEGGFGNIQNLVGTEQLPSIGSLRPQTVSSAELVMVVRFGDSAAIEASAYYQALTDAIRFNQVGSIVVAKNSGAKSTVGAELVTHLRLDAFHAYSALSTSRQTMSELTPDLAGITSFEGSPALYPRLFGYVGVDWELPFLRLKLNGELRFSSPRGASQANFYQNNSRVYELPSYWEFDVRATTFALPLLDPRLETRFTLIGRNLANSGRVEPGFAGVDIPQLGRRGVFQVSQQF